MIGQFTGKNLSISGGEIRILMYNRNYTALINLATFSLQNVSVLKVTFRQGVEKEHDKYISFFRERMIDIFLDK